MVSSFSTLWASGLVWPFSQLQMLLTDTPIA